MADQSAERCPGCGHIKGSPRYCPICRGPCTDPRHDSPVPAAEAPPDWMKKAARRIYIMMGGCQDSFERTIAEEYAKAEAPLSEDESRAREWLAKYRKPLTCIKCGEVARDVTAPGIFQHCPKSDSNTGHVYEMTCDVDAEVKMLAAYGAEMKREGMKEAVRIATGEEFHKHPLAYASACPVCRVAAAIREAI